MPTAPERSSATSRTFGPTPSRKAGVIRFSVLRAETQRAGLAAPASVARGLDEGAEQAKGGAAGSAGDGLGARVLVEVHP